MPRDQQCAVNLLEIHARIKDRICLAESVENFDHSYSLVGQNTFKSIIFCSIIGKCVMVSDFFQTCSFLVVGNFIEVIVISCLISPVFQFPFDIFKQGRLISVARTEKL